MPCDLKSDISSHSFILLSWLRCLLHPPVVLLCNCRDAQQAAPSRTLMGAHVLSLPVGRRGCDRLLHKSKTPQKFSCITGDTDQKQGREAAADMQSCQNAARVGKRISGPALGQPGRERGARAPLSLYRYATLRSPSAPKWKTLSDRTSYGSTTVRFACSTIALSSAVFAVPSSFMMMTS